MGEKEQLQGGIKARKIQANNVVSGAQIRGLDTQQTAEALIKLANTIRRGEIEADEIVALDVVIGLQYITNPAQASSEDLQRELAVTRAKVDEAIAAQEIPDQGEAERIKENLATAAKELAKPQPNGRQILDKLDDANTLLTKSAQAAEAAGKIGAQIIKLSPIIATLWQAAHHLFFS